MDPNKENPTPDEELDNLPENDDVNPDGDDIESGDGEPQDNDSDGLKGNESVEDLLLMIRGLKGKLEGAYKRRDNALRERDAAIKEKNTALKERDQARTELLRAQGKEEEALREELERERELREAAERNNVELSRDVSLRERLSSIDFRSPKAREMAFRELSGKLTRSQAGEWVGPSGESIETMVDSFTKDAGNAFMFATRVNRGAGTNPRPAPNSGGSDKPKSLRGLSTDELLAHFSGSEE